MNTLQADLINPITLTKFSPVQTFYMSYKWDVSFLKKFITPKWPYEMYKGSLLHDFLSVFFSKVS